MKLIGLTYANDAKTRIFVNPMTVQVVKQEIGNKGKSIVIASGMAYPVVEDCESIAAMMNENLKEVSK